MTKLLSTLILTLGTLFCISQNEIDNINTPRQLSDFMLKKFNKFNYFDVTDTNYILSRDSRFHHIADSLQMKYWYKVDFDKNGYTDLFAYVKAGGNTHLTYVMAFPNNSYSLGAISMDVLNTFHYFPVVDSIQGTPIIKLYYTKIHYIKNWPHDTAEDLGVYVDTLLYKFGDFIEYYPNHPSPDLDFIEYKPGENYGVIWNLKIFSDGNVIYNGIQNTKRKGKIKGKLSIKQRSQFFGLINYIDMKKIKDHYASETFDLSSVILILHFTDGKTKEIFDYGPFGTFGLSRLYSILWDIRKDNNWK